MVVKSKGLGDILHAGTARLVTHRPVPTALVNQCTHLGEPKRGDLAGVYVYKFKSKYQLMLLAYEHDPETRMPLLLGSHENFYRDLKR